ncbi:MULTISPECIES: hypothetical protein [unclassified Bradyrhizobium]|uniref:hypothetical protein n=1 Tax=unclassified Bradyrhizobium TaxID=2631580 RepID=UPI0024E19419|nr:MULTISPECIES: hypothetical protein [unclassified Bradyrhizobium]
MLANGTFDLNTARAPALNRAAAATGVISVDAIAALTRHSPRSSLGRNDAICINLSE